MQRSRESRSMAQISASSPVWACHTWNTAIVPPGSTIRPPWMDSFSRISVRAWGDPPVYDTRPIATVLRFLKEFVK